MRSWGHGTAPHSVSRAAQHRAASSPHIADKGNCKRMLDINAFEIIGYIAAALSSISFVPQVVKTHQRTLWCATDMAMLTRD